MSAKCPYCGDPKPRGRDSCPKLACAEEALRRFSLDYPSDYQPSVHAVLTQNMHREHGWGHRRIRHDHD